MIAAKVSEVNIEELNELIYSLQTIEKRSKGLVRFVEAYKSVTNIKVPVFESVNLLSILSDAKALYQEQLHKLSITCHIKSNSESVLVMADQYLLSQVFINLLKNAIEALETEETPSITIILTSENNQINVKFVDNGCGMDSETLEQVFTPFYTTKLNGSGIGLSLCRQIIRLHGGSILAISSPKTGTIMEVIL
jgi:signal transduction histidine kinase